MKIMEKLELANKMVKITATKKAKHMEPGKDYDVSEETAKILKDRGWATAKGAKVEKPKAVKKKVAPKKAVKKNKK